MKLLLVTDTHGDLEIIDRLAEKTGCGAVVHAGDFGFYDDSSYSRLTDRELKLRVVHSPLDDAAKREALELPPEELRNYVRDQLPMSDLPAYLAGDKRFKVPVYAVWGNHEDVEVVRGFYEGALQVPNLHILSERATFKAGGFRIFGLGGNLLMGKKFFQNPVAGGGGRVWSTLAQYLLLMNRVSEEAEPGEVRIFVSHVSPGKEPFISLVAAHARADLVVSGHMGPPFTFTWNEFAIRSAEDAIAMLEEAAADVAEQCRAHGRKAKGLDLDEADLLAQLPDETLHAGRGRKVPRWYRDMLYLNLPDAAAGYAVLSVGDEGLRLETFREGLEG